MPINISEYEDAWKLEDALCIIEKIYEQKKIILGGDILDNNLQYNYDNWYYEPVDGDNREENIKNSYVEACQYIQDYIKKNGKDFYVIIVKD